MKSIKNILLTGLAALVIGCQPNLSTPENTVKTLLTEMKKGNDPLTVCGYTEKMDSVGNLYNFIANTSRDNHKHYEKNYNRYDIFAENCLPDLNQCINYSGLPAFANNNPEKYENFIRLIKLNTQNKEVTITLQKESDGNWRIMSFMGPFNRE